MKIPEEIINLQNEFNCKVCELRNIICTHNDFLKDSEDFENISKDKKTELTISLRSSDSYSPVTLVVPDCVKDSIVQFVLENKEQMQKEYERQIEEKEREIKKMIKD